MGKDTKISWCDATFNPWWGCTKVSPGCANCYAEGLDKRFGGDHWGIGKARKRTSAANWRDPLKWNAEAANTLICDNCGFREPRNLGLHDERCRNCDRGQLVPWRPRVFFSMGDPFDVEVPIDWLRDFLLVISRTPNLDWLLVTKRAHQWGARMRLACADGVRNQLDGFLAVRDWLNGEAPANVWVGTTVEHNKHRNRLDDLIDIPAHVHFISAEPLLEGLILDGSDGVDAWLEDERDTPHGEPGIDWVICGGESGPGARPFNMDWGRSLRDQCVAAGVPFFMKQVGAKPLIPHRVAVNGEETGPKMLLPYRALDRAGADPAEWPADLRVQQFPTVRGAA